MLSLDLVVTATIDIIAAASTKIAIVPNSGTTFNSIVSPIGPVRSLIAWSSSPNPCSVIETVTDPRI